MLTTADTDASQPEAGREPDARAADVRPSIETREDGGTLHVALAGVWTTRMIGLVDKEMRELANREGGKLVLDLSGVSKMDTAGAWVVERLIAALSDKGTETEVTGGSEAASTLLDAVGESAHNKDEQRSGDTRNIVIRMLEAIGRGVYAMKDDFIASMNILGATIAGAQSKAGRAGHSVNITAIVHHIDKMGVGAIPVVVLMSAIVGAIVAQQGAFQLRYFGAEIFVVDLVGILVWRELGVLLTAIMIAGRSGSAITAEIGSMKMREEVDALKVIGLNPVGVLVFPRLVALVIAVPCLTIAANFAALGGAIFVTYMYSGISPETFIERMRATIDISTIFAGLIKAPFMALIIGTLASVEGMKVGGSAESLGARVTASVVKAIFVVIIVDGFFAIFYAAIDF